MAERRDHRELIDLLEVFLLGEEPSLTGNQLAEEVGISFEEAKLRWRSLGFSAVGADVPAFTHADLEALRLTQRLLEIGLIDSDDESALVRTLGRSFARLAEWQMGLLAKVVDPDTMDVDELRDVMNEVTPAVESLQNYVWRRHTLAAAARLLLATSDEETDGDAAGEQVEGEDGTTMGVGFADIVNYTRQSRSLTRGEIGRMVDHFEERALEIISSHEGRIIKTIGDELLFVADEPGAIARIGLELVEEGRRDQEFPEIRVGLAWGPALARLGDVLGPVVNMASRLTSTSRPGRVLVDRSLADQLADDDHFKLRRLRRTSVKGYRNLEPWSLRRPSDEEPDNHDSDA
ncbi:MAG: adenylate/guanylate cyclase protein [Marmoricola sp.]|nr:adenylate/guanylate cyclase protein [Marmoricola sp.]